MGNASTYLAFKQINKTLPLASPTNSVPYGSASHVKSFSISFLLLSLSDPELGCVLLNRSLQKTHVRKEPDCLLT